MDCEDGVALGSKDVARSTIARLLDGKQSRTKKVNAACRQLRYLETIA